MVSPSYLETFGVPLLQGRALDEHDTATSEPVVLVNRTIARRYWNGRSPVGEYLKLNGINYTVVGVLEPKRAQWLTDAYIGYRTVLHHLSLEGPGDRLEGQADRVVDAAPYAETRARVTEIWHETFETER